MWKGLFSWKSKGKTCNPIQAGQNCSMTVHSISLQLNCNCMCRQLTRACNQHCWWAKSPNGRQLHSSGCCSQPMIALSDGEWAFEGAGMQTWPLSQFALPDSSYPTQVPIEVQSAAPTGRHIMSAFNCWALRMKLTELISLSSGRKGMSLLSGSKPLRSCQFICTSQHKKINKNPWRCSHILSSFSSHIWATCA
jgi:hypothetical protein